LDEQAFRRNANFSLHRNATPELRHSERAASPAKSRLERKWRRDKGLLVGTLISRPQAVSIPLKLPTIGG